MNSNTFAYFIVAVVIGLAIMFFTGVINIPENDNNNSTNVNTTSTRNKDPIDPTPFNIGYIKDSPQKLANLCQNDYKDVAKSGDFWNASYPINPVYVNYGGKPIPNDCGCLEFIKAP